MGKRFSTENNFIRRDASGPANPTLQVRDISQRSRGAPNSFATQEGIQITVKNEDLAKEQVRRFTSKLNLVTEVTIAF